MKPSSTRLRTTSKVPSVRGGEAMEYARVCHLPSGRCSRIETNWPALKGNCSTSLTLNSRCLESGEIRTDFRQFGGEDLLLEFGLLFLGLGRHFSVSPASGHSPKRVAFLRQNCKADFDGIWNGWFRLRGCWTEGQSIFRRGLPPGRSACDAVKCLAVRRLPPLRPLRRRPSTRRSER